MLSTIDAAPTRVHRVVRRHNDWTLKEHEVVINHWPDVDAIHRLIPHRTRIAIQSFASKCNLTKEIHSWTGTQDSLLRKRVREGVPRRAIATELGMTLNQVANRMQYVGLHYGKKPPEPTGNRLMDAVLRRAFDLNLSRRDLDAECGGKGEPFRRWAPTRKISIEKVRHAVEFLGGELDAVWEPLEN